MKLRKLIAVIAITSLTLIGLVGCGETEVLEVETEEAKKIEEVEETVEDEEVEEIEEAEEVEETEEAEEVEEGQEVVKAETETAPEVPAPATMIDVSVAIAGLTYLDDKGTTYIFHLDETTVNAVLPDGTKLAGTYKFEANQTDVTDVKLTLEFLEADLTEVYDVVINDDDSLVLTDIDDETVINMIVIADDQNNG